MPGDAEKSDNPVSGAVSIFEAGANGVASFQGEEIEDEPIGFGAAGISLGKAPLSDAGHCLSSDDERGAESLRGDRILARGSCPLHNSVLSSSDSLADAVSVDGVEGTIWDQPVILPDKPRAARSLGRTSSTDKEFQSWLQQKKAGFRPKIGAIGLSRALSGDSMFLSSDSNSSERGGSVSLQKALSADFNSITGGENMFESGDSFTSVDSQPSDNRVELAAAPFAYRPDVEGLRAFAVIAVVIYHFDLGLAGGFTGVDIFFVISGFLITSIQLKKLEQGRFSMGSFWHKRCRRLFPAFSVMLALLLFVGWFTLLGSIYELLLDQSIAALLASANIRLYFQSSYFDSSAAEPLLHCWSLAVEEQFYLLFPVLLWSLWRDAESGRRIMIAQLIIFVFSLGISVAVTPVDNRFAFYLLPSRAWEFAMGGLLAFDPGILRTTAWAEAASWCGILCMVLSFVLFNKLTPFPSFTALLPCGGACLFIASQRSLRTSAGKLLSSRYAVSVGKVSYSLYLWHWPVYVLLKQHSTELDDSLSVFETCAGLGLSVAAAGLSFVFIETTTRYNPDSTTPNRICHTSPS